MFESLGVIALTAVVIWWFSFKLEDVAHIIAQHLKIPASVKGAVLYAIPSSFPEFCTVTISVLLLKSPVFSVGVGTIAGSAVFNILIIPAFAVLFAAAAQKQRGKKMDAINVSNYVFFRDGVFYLIAVLLFIGVALTGEMNKLFASIFLLLYGLYIFILCKDVRNYRLTLDVKEDEKIEMGFGKGMIWLISSMGVISISCYFLVEHTIKISDILEINPYIVAVILTAAATSIPDTLISVAAAKKSGEYSEESIVNAFSSNIFDILVCLSVPVLLYGGIVEIKIDENIVNLILLAVITIVALIIIKIGNRITKAKSYAFLFLYLLFILSAIFNQDILIMLSALNY